jgi:hypothetical protein
MSVPPSLVGCKSFNRFSGGGCGGNFRGDNSKGNGSGSVVTDCIRPRGQYGCPGPCRCHARYRPARNYVRDGQACHHERSPGRSYQWGCDRCSDGCSGLDMVPKAGLSLVIGLAMIINMAAAGLSGAAIPLLLKALNRDPAQSSSIFLTTVTDVVGFAAFLGFAVVCMPLLI